MNGQVMQSLIYLWLDDTNLLRLRLLRLSY